MTEPHQLTFKSSAPLPEEFMHRIAEDTAYRFDGVLGRETIDAYLVESFELYDRTIKNRLPARHGQSPNCATQH